MPHVEVATATIFVGSAANNRPVAVNDHYATTVDQPLAVPSPGLLGHDLDADGDSLTAELFSGPQNGTVVLNTDGSFLYTPASGFQGRDSFIYRIFDGEVHSALAAVTIYVNAAPPATGGGGSVVDGGNDDDSSSGCLLGGAIRRVMQHLELARYGMEDDLLDSLAKDQNRGHDNRLDSLLADDRWLL